MLADVRLLEMCPTPSLKWVSTSVAADLSSSLIKRRAARVSGSSAKAICTTSIGFSTFVMVTIGVMLGRVLGTVAGRRAELVGGVILIVIGCLILYEHLGHPAA